MPNKAADILKTIDYVLRTMGKKAAEGIVNGLTGPLRDKAAEQVAAYKGQDFGDANRQAAQSGAEGTVKPTREETFAGTPARIVTDDPETFAGSGFVPIPTQRGITETKSSAQQKSSSTYSRSTALKDAGGELLTEEGISKLEDADVSDRYKVFFGADPKDASTARSELLELFKSFNKAKNPLLD